jgi:hypothetical protein
MVPPSQLAKFQIGSFEGAVVIESSWLRLNTHEAEMGGFQSGMMVRRTAGNGAVLYAREVERGGE